MNGFQLLSQRGFVQQCSDSQAAEELFSNPPVTYYAGFDPTADSFHVGSLVPIMAMAHLQRLGHKPIAIIGGGTGLIGDPSGKTASRKILSRDDIAENLRKLSKQFNRYLTLDGESGLLIDNAEWIAGLNYIDFLRDIGRYFKVNEMLRNEGYRLRLEQEQGLSFIEFNYQLLQAYDFLVLFDQHGCKVQLGGDDQWGNMVAGVALTRKMRQSSVLALTFPLITTSRGQKMGKTESGAIWLDPTRTTPYDFYQYWINCDDRDVIRFLKLFTFLPLDEIAAFESLTGADVRQAKERLAFEATQLCHGQEAAEQARTAARAIFAGIGDDTEGVASVTVSDEDVSKGVPVIDLLVTAGLAVSKSAARRAILAGSISINGTKVGAIGTTIDKTFFPGGECIIRHGRKQVRKIKAENKDGG